MCIWECRAKSISCCPPNLRTHSEALAYRRSASSSVFATPKLLNSLKPPRLLSTTTTLMVPVLFLFLRGNMMQRYTNFLSHPSHQTKFPVYRGFKRGNTLEMLKPPKSGNESFWTCYMDAVYIPAMLYSERIVVIIHQDG